MRASRNRLGSSARITYALTRPATVTLTFLQARAGMVVGTRCKTPPRRFPRGRGRCTRWVGVTRSLDRAAPAGLSKLRFGGWVGGRRLAPGRYRVRAQPVEVGGPVAAARLAGFRVAATPARRR
jgi:hypothetical protein